MKWDAINILLLSIDFLRNRDSTAFNKENSRIAAVSPLFLEFWTSFPLQRWWLCNHLNSLWESESECGFSSCGLILLEFCSKLSMLSQWIVSYILVQARWKWCSLCSSTIQVEIHIWIVATVVIVMQEGSAADANKWKSDRSVKPHSSGVKQPSSVQLQNTIGCKYEEVAFHLWEKAEVLSHKRGCTLHKFHIRSQSNALVQARLSVATLEIETLLKSTQSWIEA